MHATMTRSEGGTRYSVNENTEQMDGLRGAPRDHFLLDFLSIWPCPHITAENNLTNNIITFTYNYLSASFASLGGTSLFGDLTCQRGNEALK